MAGVRKRKCDGDAMKKLREVIRKHKKALMIILIPAVYLVIAVLLTNGIFSKYVYGLLMIAGIYIITAESLNLTTGFLGQMVLGQAAFMSIGAFMSAICTLHMNLPVHIQIPVSILIGGFVTALAGTLIAIPALKLSGGYLAVVTLAFVEIIQNLFQNMDITGQAIGLKNITKFPMNTSNYSSTYGFTYVYWSAVIIMLVIVRIIKSEHGRQIIAIRDNQIAAQAVGTNITIVKIKTFMISAFFAGIAGGLYTHYMGAIYADKFSTTESFEMLVMVILGGMGNIPGVVIATLVVKWLPELLRSFSVYRTLIFGILLVVITLYKNTTMKEFVDVRINGLKKVLSGNAQNKSRHI